MTIHDFTAARERKLREALNSSAKGNTTARPAQDTKDRAILTSLTAMRYVDTQLYAVVLDLGPDPKTGKMVPGYHILQYAPKIGSDALPYEVAESYSFVLRHDFDARFAGTGEMVGPSLSWLFAKFNAQMKNPHGFAEICRRNIGQFERVMRDGLYSPKDGSPHFPVKAYDYVLTPVEGAPEVISDREAHRRIYSLDKNGKFKPIPL